MLIEYGLWGIVVIVTIFYALVVFSLFFGLVRLRQFQECHQPPVSVIIAARNEAANIDACLRGIAEQDYSQELLEVIVVDDRSTDKTADIVKDYAGRYKWLKLVQIKDPPDYPSAKKWALAQGIAATSNDILLFTDADCIPPRSWVSTVVKCYSEQVGLVAGFSPLQSKSGRVRNLFLGLDSLAAGFVAAGTIGLGTTSTCCGRNLSYRRKVFDEVGGFEAIAQSVSGDDDLFLQLVKRRTRWHIAYAISPETMVPANGPATFREFIKQKKRHLSAGRYYGIWQQICYGAWHAANVAIWILPVLALFIHPGLIIFWAIKLFIDFIALWQFARQFRLTHLLWGLPLWELFFVVYHVFIGPLSLVGKVRWKE